jgi:hypothetical protein
LSAATLILNGDVQDVGLFLVAPDYLDGLQTLETVQNLGVVTPLNETDAGANFRLRHAHGGGVPRPVQPVVYGSTCWHWTGRAG